MRIVSFSTLVLSGLLSLAACGGTDHRLIGDTQAGTTYIAPPGSTIVVPPSGPARACPYGKVC